MTLDPQVRVVLDQIASLDTPPPEEQTPAEARVAYEVLGGLSSRPDGVSADDIEVAGAEGPLAARVYRPASYLPASAAGRAPGLVYFHGGGYVIGSIDSHDGACGRLADSSGCTVVSVDYRLAPEHPLPAAVDDGLAAHRDVVARAAELGLDPERIAVGGDSAGGHLALTIALAARDGDQPRPAALLLVYPVADWALDQPSVDENAEGYVLTRATMLWFREMAVPDGADPASALSSPLRQDLRGLPPTIVVTAGFDPLRDQGDELAARLAEAGVPVRHLTHPDLIHTFVQLTAVSDRCREATDEIGRRLGNALKG